MVAGISEIVIAALVLALLVVQVLMLWCVMRHTRVREKDVELKELMLRVAELVEESVSLQKETNRLLKRIVFEEADDDNEVP